jgi:hypothetical protein
MGSRHAVRSLVVLVAAACGSVTDPLPESGPARTLDLLEGGFGTELLTVALRGDTLFVTRRAWSDGEATTRRVVPDAAAWRLFWTEAQQAGVRRWPARCRDERVVDGGGFTVVLEWPGGTLRGEYVNSFPRADGRCSGDPTLTGEARGFVRAVRRLAGEPTPEG